MLLHLTIMNTSPETLNALFPAPSRAPRSFGLTPSRVFGSNAKSVEALREYLKDNHRKRHIFFNDRGFHKYVYFTFSDVLPDQLTSYVNSFHPAMQLTICLPSMPWAQMTKSCTLHIKLTFSISVPRSCLLEILLTRTGRTI